MSKNILVKLGGVDVTSYLVNAVKTETYGNAISIYEFTFTKNVNNAVAISNALTVGVWLDSGTPPTTKVFDGFIDLFKPETGMIKIVAKDQLALLINKQVMKEYDSATVADPSYPDGKISAIFKDLVETYGGLDTNSGATVQDSGTEFVLTKFTCRNADVFERCRKLADTLNWVFYYDASDGFVYFEPKNFTTNANTLTVGTNIVEIPIWEYDRSEMINDLRLEGANQLVNASEVFSGNASDLTFSLSNIPEDISVYYSASKNFATTAKIQSETKIGNIANSLGTFDYSVDKKNKKITFTSFTPASATNNILVEVSYYAPIPIHMEEPVSITTYGTYAKTIGLTDVFTLEDAWKRAENILGKYSNPFISSKELKVYWTPTLDIKIGQSVKIVDTLNDPNIDKNFTIYKIIDYYPQSLVGIEVGDKQYTIEEYQSNILERVKRLEESVIGPTEAVTEIKQTTLEFNVVPDTTTVLIQNINDSFILGHPVNGVLGAGTCVGSWSFDEGSGTTAIDATGVNDGTITGAKWTEGVAWWKLDDAVGVTAVDSIGTNDGTITGASWTTGQFNGALEFGGDGDRVNITSTSIFNFGASQDFSISVWIKPADVIGIQKFVCKDDGTNRWILYLDGNKFKMLVDDDATQVVSSSSTELVAGTWYHLVGTFDRDGNQKLYVDKINEDTDSISTVGSVSNAVAIGIGAVNDGGAPFNGTIDEVRIFDRVLSTGEIDLLYANNLISKYGNSLSFVGANAADKVVVPRSAVLEPANISVSCWINIPSAPSGTADMILSKGTDGSKEGWLFSILTTGKAEFKIYDGTNHYIVETASAIPTNEWVHLVGTFDESNVKIYVNTVVATTAAAVTMDQDESKDLEFGTHYGTSGWFTGLLDEVKIYSNALSSDEIIELFNLRPASATSGIARLGNRMTTSSTTTYTW